MRSVHYSMFYGGATCNPVLQRDYSLQTCLAICSVQSARQFNTALQDVALELQTSLPPVTDLGRRCYRHSQYATKVLQVL